jgi:hypothetical protein
LRKKRALFPKFGQREQLTDEWPFALLRMWVRSTMSRKPADSMIERR